MKISVITISWNSAATIADTITSVNRQTCQDIEHVFVDGGSTDATLAIIEAHATAPETRVSSEPDDGIYDAMNKGIAMATGDVLALLNSDDVYADADVLDAVMTEMRTGEVDLVYADVVYVDEHDPSIVRRRWQSGEYRSGSFRDGWHPPHPAVFLTADAYARVGAFDPSYRIAGDFEFLLRAFEKSGLRIRYLPRVLVRMRLGGASNASLKQVARGNREIIRALKAHDVKVSAFTYVVRRLLSKLRQYL